MEDVRADRGLLFVCSCSISPTIFFSFFPFLPSWGRPVNLRHSSIAYPIYLKAPGVWFERYRVGPVCLPSSLGAVTSCADHTPVHRPSRYLYRFFLRYPSSRHFLLDCLEKKTILLRGTKLPCTTRARPILSNREHPPPCPKIRSAH